jgi:molybdopterin-guanine dinucleotide biosynthesis protein A
MTTCGYIQAGGRSTRFGRDKSLVEFGGKTMLERMCELLRKITHDVAIVSPAGKYNMTRARLVADLWPGEGALGGIITALIDASKKKTPADWALIVSCDMPFLSEAWLRHMVKRATESDADIIVPRSATGLEPLCACWRVSAAGKVRVAFEEGVRKISDAFERLRMETLDAADWKRFDTAGRLFWNMNTEADYEEALRIWESSPS